MEQLLKGIAAFAKERIGADAEIETKGRDSA